MEQKLQQQSEFGFMSDIKPTIQQLTLADRFVVPPFSILDTRQGYWQERKRQWLSLGIQSEVGRGNTTNPGSAGDRREGRISGKYEGGHAWLSATQSKVNLAVSQAAAVGSGGLCEQIAPKAKRKGYQSDKYNEQLSEGDRKALGCYIAPQGNVIDRAQGRVATSVFDPVLCELAYKWWCPIGGSILDQFAGGSVRGIVAEILGYKYTGIEIRKEQVEANLKQAKDLQLSPTYILGDCTKTLDLLPQDAVYDLIFTCPPYYDLEIYSDVMDNMGDMSVYHSYFSFIIWYEVIFKQSVARLKNNRFLVVVVSDIRDKDGVYRGFVADNIACFKKLGLQFYNEAILINVAGSLPVRVSNQFPNSRKLGRSHQNVLVFYKGDLKKIKDLEFVDKSLNSGDGNGC